MTLFRIWNFGTFGHHTNIWQQAHKRICIANGLWPQKQMRVLCEDKFEIKNNQLFFCHLCAKFFDLIFHCIV